MKDFLLRTRKESNIFYLRARDYYFLKSKKYHQYKKIFIALPSICTLLIYGILVVCAIDSISTKIWVKNVMTFVTDYAELLLGICTIFAFFAVKFLESKSDHYKEKSNIQREMYDNTVFQLKNNLFSYDYQLAEKEKELGRRCPENYNNWKYERWYDETFSDDLNRNILCMQMDNAVYSYHVFVLCKKTYVFQFIILMVFLAMLILFAYLLMGWSMCLLVMFAMFELLSEKWEEITIAEDMICRNKSLINTVSNPDNVAQILGDLPHHIYCIQQCMIENRKKGLFLPKKIRNMYIDYYDELNYIKNIYLDDETTGFPESSAEIEIYNNDESKTHTLKDLQTRLSFILEEVTSLMEINTIPYYLDRGSLLGAVRPVRGAEEDRMKSEYGKENTVEGRMLFWEDMIHITIPRGYEEILKKLVEESYSQKYAVQDINSENFMSFHRYELRVREKNHLSHIHTKELLSPLFEEKGIYITVNTIGAIVGNPCVDMVIRWVLFHSLLRKLSKQNDIVYQQILNENEKKLCKEKQKYGQHVTKYKKWLQIYIKLAKSKKWVGYTPGNVYQLSGTQKNKKSKYFPIDMIFGDTTKVKFEGNAYPAPKRYDEYLERLYGEFWRTSPFRTKEELKREKKNSWYSEANRFQVSSLKHTRRVDL